MDRPNDHEPAVALATPPDRQLREYAVAELTRAIACLGWRSARLHTGVHQARKSLRRTRATLALGMPLLGPGADLIDRELRRVNRSLSKLRDAHALVTALDHLIAKHAPADDDTLHVLRRVRRIAAHARAECAHTALARDAQLQDKRALLATLLAALPALKWDAIDAMHVGVALQRSQIEADTAGAKARAAHHDEDWHRWRRRARRLSQQHRALGDAFARPRADGKHDKQLAVLLGHAQDYAMLREHCGRKSPFTPTDRQALDTLAENKMKRLRERVAARASETLAGAFLPEEPETDLRSQ
jgi:CHAD domain-containing protein